jgi:hypothetical protein
MRRFKLVPTIMSACVLAVSCAASPVDSQGMYTVAVTNRDNGCNLPNYTVGEMTSNIGVTVTQQGTSATVEVMGLTAVLLDLLLGSSTFSGTVDGNSLDLKALGTNPQTTGNCTFTYDAAIDTHLDGDVLTGEIHYTTATNGNPDCAPIADCVTVQDFNGTRPPT